MDLDLDIIEKEWSEDCKIDQTDLERSSIKIQELHSKYFRFLNQAKKMLRTFEADKKRMILIMTDYYLCNLSKEELSDYNLKPRPQGPVLKQDMDKYLESDERIIELNMSIGECNDIIDFCNSIIDNINRRSFIIKNINEHRKFISGGY